MRSARLCSARALTSAARPGRVASMGLKSRVRTCAGRGNGDAILPVACHGQARASGQARSTTAPHPQLASRRSASPAPLCLRSLSPAPLSRTHHPADAAGEGAVGAGEGAQRLLVLLRQGAGGASGSFRNGSYFWRRLMGKGRQRCPCPSRPATLPQGLRPLLSPLQPPPPAAARSPPPPPAPRCAPPPCSDTAPPPRLQGAQHGGLASQMWLARRVQQCAPQPQWLCQRRCTGGAREQQSSHPGGLACQLHAAPSISIQKRSAGSPSVTRS